MIISVLISSKVKQLSWGASCLVTKKVITTFSNIIFHLFGRMVLQTYVCNELNQKVYMQVMIDLTFYEGFCEFIAKKLILVIVIDTNMTLKLPILEDFNAHKFLVV